MSSYTEVAVIVEFITVWVSPRSFYVASGVDSCVEVVCLYDRVACYFSCLLKRNY